ncbi:alpha/beta fold hydrolase [Arthrobacter sp. TmT3-37]
MTDIVAHRGLLKNTKLHVDDTGGTGHPVVLIPGWPLSGEAFKNQAFALHAAGYRVITYDRRGFDRSDKPMTGYTYDTLTENLQALLEELDLRHAPLVKFSMGAGEIARYFSKYSPERIRSVVFASAVPPFMMHGEDNSQGPLTKEAAAGMTADLTKDQESLHDGFATNSFSANGVLKVTEGQRQDALELCWQADKKAALACMEAFGTTDFRTTFPESRFRLWSCTATRKRPCRSRAPAVHPRNPCRQ